MPEPAKSPIPIESAKSARPASGRLRRILRHNLGLRLLSVFLAIALWVFVNAGEHTDEVQLEVPVRYSSLPAGLVIINDHPQFIKVTVAGTPTMLSLLDPDRLTLKLNLNGVGAGQASFRLTAEMFSEYRGTSVTRIVPSQIVLDIDRIIKRGVPVKLDLDGKPATGYRVASTQVMPSEVEANGPSRFVSAIKHVETEPLSIEDASADIDAPVRVLDPGARVSLGTEVVEARVMLTQVIVDREFKGLKVQVRDTASRSRIDPAVARVTIRGPLLKLAKLDLGDAVFVDASGIEPGAWHIVPLEVSLPDGLQVVRHDPQNVRLRVYR
ncbi:MAG TPA: CdaR family protein [Candidatus Binataceae bacterium]|nr:CdaR family protein [Candidatus Binataceae bacterium]